MLRSMLWTWQVFPAYAGMNRECLRVRIHAHSVPRVCGDEPVHHLNRAGGQWCSPRMRG